MRVHAMGAAVRTGALGCFSALAACSGGPAEHGATGPGPEPGAVRTVAIAPPSAELTGLDQTQRFQATAKDASGSVVPGVRFDWSSSDGTVATVDDGGTAVARGNGRATIRATASGRSGTADVRVRAGPLAWERISAGLVNTCGVTTHRTIYCWGENVHQQLGSSEYGQSHPLPVEVEAPVTLQVVSVGGGHVCGLTGDGAAYCWGLSGFGERGDGTLGSQQPTPSRVQGAYRFAEISAGGNHTCAVTRDGDAYCWGSNRGGQLGDGTAEDRLVPVAVRGDHRFARIEAGESVAGNHTCAVTAEGEAWCWGRNDRGQLGDGTTESSPTPVRVAGGHAFERIGLGDVHTCALTRSGAAYCWGGNAAGELGDGTQSDSHEPVAVAGGHRFTDLPVADYHACGLTSGGATYCWGSNAFGELGDGTGGVTATPVQVAGGHLFERIDAGPGHTCGLTASGIAYCWGINTFGKLGDGTAAPRYEPVRVRTPWREANP